jgi:hypothetical protein
VALSGFFHAPQPSPPDSISRLASNALSYRFLSVTHHRMSPNLTFLIVGFPLDVILSSASTSHNSGLLDTFTAHHITSFTIIAPSCDSSGTPGAICNVRLAVTVPLCTGTRGLSEFSWVMFASRHAQLDSISIDITDNILRVPSLILALTSPRPPKFITPTGLPQ